MAGLAALLATLVLPTPAGAAPSGEPETDRDDPGFVEVVEVSGLLDPVLVSFIERSIDRAEERDAVALVLQLDSSGALVDDAEFVELGRRIVEADIPIAVWVGTSGADAHGAASELVAIAEASAMAPGTSIGKMGHQRLPVDEFGLLFGDEHDRMLDDAVGSKEAVELGLVTDFGATAPLENEVPASEMELVRGAPTVRHFVSNLEGVTVTETTEDGQPQRELVTVVIFDQLPLLDQFVHSAASPNVAYLLLVVGLGLIVFELFTAGVGIAGVLGAGCLVASCYGLWILPVRWWAFGLLLAAFFGFAVDVQTGVPRFWTGAGFVCFVIGSLFLFDGVSLSWITLLVGIVGVLLTFLAGMPAMVRTRFATPTIGRDWMIGEMGEAVGDVDPEGTVRVREAQWRAFTNRATPIHAGQPVRVVAIDGLTLEVEPPEGAARDYRERRST